MIKQSLKAEYILKVYSSAGPLGSDPVEAELP